MEHSSTSRFAGASPSPWLTVAIAAVRRHLAARASRSTCCPTSPIRRSPSAPSCPGAAPLEVENLITRPVEEAVGVVRNVRQVRSVSRSGQSDVIARVHLGHGHGHRRHRGAREARPAAAAARSDAPAAAALRSVERAGHAPRVRRQGTPTTAGAARGRGCKILRRFADDRLKPEIESVEGSAAVKVSGGFEDEIQIYVDQQRLAQLGLSIEAGRAAASRAENVNLSGGRLEQGTQRFLVRTVNEFDVARRDGERGHRHRRRPARVSQGRRARRRTATRTATRSRASTAASASSSRSTRKATPTPCSSRSGSRAASSRRSRRRCPPAAETRARSTTSRRSSQRAISEVKFAAILGGLLAILVLYFFLRDARATFITGIAIPVSVVGTFVLMYMSDLSLNIMSLGGIALVVGMVVDNSVVVLEAIVRKRKERGLLARRGGARGHARGGHRRHRLDADVGRGVLPDGVRLRHRRAAVPRPGADGHLRAAALSLLVALTLVPMLAAGVRDAATRRTTARCDAARSRSARAVGTRRCATLAGAGSDVLRGCRISRDAGSCSLAAARACAAHAGASTAVLRAASIRRADPLGARAPREGAARSARCCSLATVLIVPQLGTRADPAARAGRVQRGPAPARRHAARDHRRGRRARPDCERSSCPTSTLPTPSPVRAIASTRIRSTPARTPAARASRSRRRRRHATDEERAMHAAARLSSQQMPGVAVSSSAAPACSRSRRRWKS